MDTMTDYLTNRMEVKLPNGYKVSIIWHMGAYANPDMGTVETAIIAPNEQFVPWAHGDHAEGLKDDVQCYQNAVQVAQTIAHAASL